MQIIPGICRLLFPIFTCVERNRAMEDYFNRLAWLLIRTNLISMRLFKSYMQFDTIDEFSRKY